LDVRTSSEGWKLNGPNATKYKEADRTLLRTPPSTRSECMVPQVFKNHSEH